MSVTPPDLLNLAHSLHLASACEAEYRNTVGRAYYFAYHAALKFHTSLPSPGEEPKERLGTHARLIYRLDKPSIDCKDPRYKLSRLLALKLNGFRKLRGIADYELDTDVTRWSSSDALIKASAIREIVDKTSEV